MPDETPAPVPTSPPAPGRATSEFSLTKVVMGISAALQVAGVVLAALPHANPWVGVALAVVGSLKQIAALFTYTTSRTAVKVAAAAPDPAPVLDVAGLVQQLLQAKGVPVPAPAT